MSRKPAEGLSQRIRTLGVDPGFAKMGVAVLEKTTAGSARAIHLRVIETKKASKKELRSLRVASDDQWRLHEIWSALDAVGQEYGPFAAVGVETYSPYRGTGSGWKAALAYQLVCCQAWNWGVSALPFMPQDIKRAFAGNISASKGDIIEAMGSKIVSFVVHLEGIAKTKHEHVADAAGHAYLAIEEIYKVRHMLGM